MVTRTQKSGSTKVLKHESTIFLVDLDLQLHHISAGGSPHQASANVGVVLVEGAYVARVVVVTHHILVVASVMVGLGVGEESVVMSGRGHAWRRGHVVVT